MENNEITKMDFFAGCALIGNIIHQAMNLNINPDSQNQVGEMDMQQMAAASYTQAEIMVRYKQVEDWGKRKS